MAGLSPEVRQLINDSVDVESLLRSLGFQISNITSTDVRAPCKLHGGDNPTAFSIRKDIKKWRCFTKHCEQDAQGGAQNDLIALVRKCTGLSFLASVKYLCSVAGLRLDESALTGEGAPEGRRKRETLAFVRRQQRFNERHREQPKLSEDVVENYISLRDGYFLERGFSPDTLEYFEVGAMFDGLGVRRATIPIRDAQGGLVSISARREDGDEDPRYLLEKEFNKGRILYNLHNASKYSQTTVVVVEGFKALWAVHEAGIPNVVACMGSIVTEEQVLSLRMAGFLNCVLMLDGDDAGRKGTKASKSRLQKTFNVSVVYLPEGKSPDNYSRNELSELLELYLETFN